MREGLQQLRPGTCELQPACATAFQSERSLNEHQHHAGIYTGCKRNLGNSCCPRLVPRALLPCPHFTPSGQEVNAQQKASLQALLEGSLLCNDSALTKDDSSGSAVYSPNGAPTEVSLITAAMKAGLQPATLKQEKPRVASVPFESEHKVGVAACWLQVSYCCFLAVAASGGPQPVQQLHWSVQTCIQLCCITSCRQVGTPDYAKEPYGAFASFLEHIWPC